MIEIVFIGDEPPVNTYIRVVKGTASLLPSKGGLTKKVLMIHGWMFNDLADLRPSMGFRELEDRVSERGRVRECWFSANFTHNTWSAHPS